MRRRTRKVSLEEEEADGHGLDSASMPLPSLPLAADAEAKAEERTKESDVEREGGRDLERGERMVHRRVSGSAKGTGTGTGAGTDTDLYRRLPWFVWSADQYYEWTMHTLEALLTLSEHRLVAPGRAAL